MIKMRRVFMLKLTEESDAQKSKIDREIDSLKYELQSRNNELDQLQGDCLKYAEASKEFNAKLDKVNKENCTLQNQLRVSWRIEPVPVTCEF